MTEKRFKENNEHLEWRCIAWDNNLNKWLSLKEVVELLNALREENERLKEEKQQWYRIDSRLRVRIKQLEEGISDTN